MRCRFATEDKTSERRNKREVFDEEGVEREHHTQGLK